MIPKISRVTFQVRYLLLKVSLVFAILFLYLSQAHATVNLSQYKTYSFPELFVSVSNLGYDHTQQEVFFNVDSNGQSPIDGYKVLFYSDEAGGETNFEDDVILDFGPESWMPYSNDGRARYIWSYGSKLNTGDRNASVAVVFKHSNGQLTRSGVISTHNTQNNAYSPIWNLRTQSGGILEWETPSNGIFNYEMRFFTGEILSQQEFINKLANGNGSLPAGTCLFGYLYGSYGNSCRDGYSIQMYKGMSSRLNLGSAVSKENTSYFIRFQARNGEWSQWSNETHTRPDAPAENPNKHFTEYPIVIDSLSYDKNNSDIVWSLGDGNSFTHYKILYYTGETDTLDDIITDEKWIKYDNDGRAKYINGYGSKFYGGSYSNPVNHTVGVVFKDDNGWITRSGVLSTFNDVANRTAPISTLRFEGERNDKFRWTTPTKGISEYELVYFTGQIMSTNDLNNRIANGQGHAACRFGRSWSDNGCVGTVGFNEGEGIDLVLTYRYNIPVNTSIGLRHRSRNGNWVGVGNVINTIDRTTSNNLTFTNIGKAFQMFPISKQDLWFDNSIDALRWGGSGSEDITHYQIQFFTGETDFFNTHATQNGWQEYNGSRRADRIWEYGSDFHVHDNVNHSLAVLFRDRFGNISRSGVISTNNNYENQVVPVSNLAYFSSNIRRLQWTNPTKGITSYELVWITGEELSTSQLQNKINTGYTYASCEFGYVDAWHNTGCVSNFLIGESRGTTSWVELQFDIPANSSVAIRHYARNGQMTSLSNTINRFVYGPNPNPQPQPNPQPDLTPVYTEFPDISPYDWFASYVSDLREKGIITGDSTTGNFRPGEFVNRAEAAKIFVLAKGDNPSFKTGAYFCDVKTTDWFHRFVNHLYINNWAEGYVGGDCIINREFRAGNKLTRAEAVKMLLAIYEVKIEPVNFIDVQMFSDVNPGDWFAPYVKKAFDLGFINGYEDGTFRPFEYINRAEIAKITKVVRDQFSIEN